MANLNQCPKKYSRLAVEQLQNYLKEPVKKTVLGSDDRFSAAKLLTEKIKAYEAKYEQILPAKKPYLVRLDGVAFRTLTKKMQKPFDERFTRSMNKTAIDLTKTWNSFTTFCQSDEITLLFPGCDAVATMHYGGRVQKIASTIASFASARFNFYLSQEQWQTQVSQNAFFDARVFSVDDEVSAMDAIYWRRKFDLRRNAINAIGSANFSSKTLHRLSQKEVIEKLMLEKNLDINSINKLFLFGVFFKKSQYQHTGIVKNLLIPFDCLRTKVEGRVFDWNCDEKKRVELSMRRFWIEADPQSVVESDDLTSIEDDKEFALE